MTPQEVQAAQEAGAVLLDMRTPKVFAEEHIPGAINLQFNRADLVDRAELVLPEDLQLIVQAKPAAIAKVAVKLLEEGGFTVVGNGKTCPQLNSGSSHQELARRDPHHAQRGRGYAQREPQRLARGGFP